MWKLEFFVTKTPPSPVPRGLQGSLPRAAAPPWGARTPGRGGLAPRATHTSRARGAHTAAGKARGAHTGVSVRLSLGTAALARRLGNNYLAARVHQVVVAGQGLHTADAVRRAALGARLWPESRSGEHAAPTCVFQLGPLQLPVPHCSSTAKLLWELSRGPADSRLRLNLRAPGRAIRRRPVLPRPLPPARGLARHCWRRHLVPDRGREVASRMCNGQVSDEKSCTQRTRRRMTSGKVQLPRG